MFKKALFPGKYIQGPGALGELAAVMEALGRRGLILASPTSRAKILPAIGLDGSASFIIETFGGECSEAELTRVSEIIGHESVDVVAAVGGGKTIDTAKITADRAGLPVVVAPTIASTDAPCSGCAVIYSQDNMFESVYYQKMNPAAVIVDESVIVQAPVRFLVSGMGDALATWFEADSCRRTQSANACGGLSTTLGLHIARLCYDILLEYGQAAKIACVNQVITPAFSRVVEANTLLSGIGFESGGLGAAHSIHNGLTALEEPRAFYHGEKVAFGVLAGLQLGDVRPAVMDEVYSFCEIVGLPTTLADLGLADQDRVRLMQVAQKACAPDECIHHEAGEIMPEKVLQAIIAADALGRSRKA
jgi:glycerol dehydrogenase